MSLFEDDSLAFFLKQNNLRSTKFFHAEREIGKKVKKKSSIHDVMVFDNSTDYDGPLK